MSAEAYLSRMNSPQAGDPRKYCFRCRYRDVLEIDRASRAEVDRCTHEANRNVVTGKIGNVSCAEMRLVLKECGVHGNLWEPVQ